MSSSLAFGVGQKHGDQLAGGFVFLARQRIAQDRQRSLALMAGQRARDIDARPPLRAFEPGGDILDIACGNVGEDALEQILCSGDVVAAVPVPIRQPIPFARELGTSINLAALACL